MQNHRSAIDVAMLCTTIGTLVAVAALTIQWYDRSAISIRSSTETAVRVEQMAERVSELVVAAETVLKLDEKTTQLERRVCALENQVRTLEIESARQSNRPAGRTKQE